MLRAEDTWTGVYTVAIKSYSLLQKRCRLLSNFGKNICGKFSCELGLLPYRRVQFGCSTVVIDISSSCYFGTKTEVMWLGSNRQLSQITISVIPLQSAIIRVSESARDPGIFLDCKLTMSEHVSALFRSGFYHLRQLRPVTRSLTPAAVQTVVQAFISCRLDHSLVTRYYMASARTWCDASDQFKMPPHVFSLEPDAEITSRRCDVACTGFRSGGGSTSSWRALFICHWLDKLLIASPRIFTSLLQVQVASSVPLRTGRAVSHARAARPATEALPQQGLVCGTVCHRIYATKNSVFGASGAY